MYAEYRDNRGRLPILTAGQALAINEARLRKKYAAALMVRLVDTGPLARIFAPIGWEYWDYVAIYGLGVLRRKVMDGAPHHFQTPGFEVDFTPAGETVMVRGGDHAPSMALDRHELLSWLSAAEAELIAVKRFLQSGHLHGSPGS